MPKPSGINEKRDQIIRFISEQIAEKGYPPSVREIARAVDVRSSSTIHNYLAKLKEYMQIVEVK